MMNYKALIQQYPKNTIMSGTCAWSDYTNSDPITDILKALSVLQENLNTVRVSCSPDVHKTLMFHPDFIHWYGQRHPLADKIYQAENLRHYENVFILSGERDSYLILPLGQNLSK